MYIVRDRQRHAQFEAAAATSHAGQPLESGIARRVGLEGILFELNMSFSHRNIVK